MEKSISFKINGLSKTFLERADRSLVDVLRENGYNSVKKSCETSTCGACTVLLDGLPVLACSMYVGRVQGHEITTIEGIYEEAEKIADRIVNQGAEQCGFCSPGLVLCVYSMKRESSNWTDDKINRYLAGNLCRCSGYEGQLRAIKEYLRGEMA